MRKQLVMLSFLTVTVATASVYAQDRHPIMHPDISTLRQWMAEYENAPKAYIHPRLGARMGSQSVLSHLDYVPAERNQGNCGDCWTWAGTGCLEVALDVQKGIFDRLSVQYITSCYGTGNNFACCGGTATMFADWYGTKGKAIPWTNTHAAFTESNSACPGSSSVTCGTISTTPNYSLTSISATQITTDSVSQATAISNIKNVLDQNKAVFFAFFLATQSDWNAFFDFWDNQTESVLFNYDTYKSHTWDPNNGGGHAVLCVGYDDSDADANKHYWIILNSWGTATGRSNGLFRVKMNMDYTDYFTDSGTHYDMMEWWTFDTTYGNVATPTAGAPTATPTRTPTPGGPTATPTRTPTRTSTPTITPTPAAIIISEGFEGATYPPTDWTESGTTRENTYNHTDSGTYSAFINSGTDSLITSLLSCPGTLTFWYYPTSAVGMNVKYGSSTSGPWTAVADSPFTGGTAHQWQLITVDLSSYTDIYIQFSRSVTSGNHYIDDVRVTLGNCATATPTRTPTPVSPTATPTRTATPASSTATPTRTPTPTITATPAPNAVVVNQVCPFATPGEYVELYNTGLTPVNLSGWVLNVYQNDYTFTGSDIIPAHGYFLVSDTSPVSGVTPDVTCTINITDNGASSYAQLLNASSQVMDTVGWATSSLYEGTILGTLGSGKAWARNTDGVDTDNNLSDFSAITPDPRNSNYSSSSPTPTSAPTITPTNTPAPPTATPTRTATPASSTATPTRTPTPTITPTGPMRTPTRTPTPTPTPTITPTPTNTQTPRWGCVRFGPSGSSPAPGFYKDDGSAYGTYGGYGWL